MLIGFIMDNLRNGKTFGAGKRNIKKPSENSKK
jgi:hypothetical protein